MSIWGSWPMIGWDDFAGDPEWREGQVRSYASGWSNHYPTTDGKVEQPASVDLASIPVWCVPGHREEDITEAVGPWLRLSVNSQEHSYLDGGRPTGKAEYASVVLDEDAVRALATQLQDWLSRDKARPQEDA